MLLVRHSRSLDVWSLGKDSEAKDAAEHRRSGDSLPVSTKPRLELTLKQSDDSTRGHHISSATISQCGQWVSCITGGAHFPVAHVYHLTVTVDRDGDRSVKASRVSLRFDKEACDALSAAKALRVSEWSGRQRPRILSQRGVFLGGGEGAQEGGAGGKGQRQRRILPLRVQVGPRPSQRCVGRVGPACPDAEEEGREGGVFPRHPRHLDQRPCAERGGRQE